MRQTWNTRTNRNVAEFWRSTAKKTVMKHEIKFENNQFNK